MNRHGTTSGTLFAIVISIGVITSLSRAAAAAAPTTTECLAAYEDSVSLTKTHQLRAALAKLAVCSADPCPAEIRTECLARVPDTEASVPTVVFEAKDGAGASLFDVEVKMDGEVLADRLSGSALAVDPGEHTFTFEAPTGVSVEKKLLIFEGEKRRRERVDFEAAAAPKPVVTAPVALAKPEAAVQPEKAAEARSTFGRARTLALVLGGVGVVATGIGVAYGLITKSRRDNANDICPNQCANQDGVDAWNRAQSAGNIATAAFVVGVAGIASGVTIWVLAKPAADNAPSAQVGMGLGGLQLMGKW